MLVGRGSNLGGSRPDVVGVVMKGRQEGMRRRGGGSRMIGSTHICGSVSCVVPHIIHQAREVFQAVRDVVRQQQDAHRLRTHRVKYLLSVSKDNREKTYKSLL